LPDRQGADATAIGFRQRLANHQPQAHAAFLGCVEGLEKTLQDIVRGGSIENNLMFSGHNAFRFAKDPFYSNGFIPTVKQLVERILTGR